ncbi:MAG: bifunctional oligoribonuclease/PAP phosphatase NrnA [Acidobacteria bacterium]|nr:bifunctional oligoribonuclease/PAP phosphatase NrnA [Acidobacteriota bacterium]NIM64075.1 bifunctional oligoribonuclease/PAP phosphatase NrnA [Acidobacteriota bacterium]NIO60971.1 bifunctional oligoribonuclease/PAP phosphatase NrnA [Acidobacteriota bacterium]NIQ31987.1 bifunctional oligoribonuclease/PAP phosphatase NrnA [Acidobacteriota bacterium]NIQ87483.1 bifunctional oligoribonuclease/PAP phosphatase NrnA [Acidobacteriota bacterium]
MQLTAEQHECFAANCEGHESFVLTTHMKPDGDALGSQIALARYLVSSGKNVRLINGDPTPETLAFMAEDSPKIEVYDPEVHDEEIRGADRVVLVDNSAPDRLGRMEPIMLAVAGNVLCIDHHPTREAPWAENILKVGASSTAVLIWDLLQNRGWEPDSLACNAIFVGLATDTGFFRFNSTSPYTHRTAAELLERGVRTGDIYRRVYERNSAAYTRLLGHALANLVIDGGGRIAAVHLRRELIADLEAEDEDTGEITTALLAIDGVDVVLLFRELPDARVKVSLRSKDELDVHGLASGYGGGGHRNAAGIVIERPFDEVVEQVTAGARDLVA